MAYTVTTRKGYGERLKNSVKKTISGIVLFLGATSFLFWNEGRAVKTSEAIMEAEEITTHVDDVSQRDAGLEGKMIHATAMAESLDTLRDDTFGAAQPAIKLIRKVEYYQWMEKSETKTEESFGGGEETVTTYTYKKIWCDYPLDSEKFEDPAYKNKNFVIEYYDSEETLAENVTFGAYRLPQYINDAIEGEKEVKLEMDSAQHQELNHLYIENLRASGHVAVKNLTDSLGREANYLHVKGNRVYIGRNESKPEIGDLRITFTYIPSQEVSLISKVTGDTFEKYRSKNGYDFWRVDSGSHSMGNMFQSARNDNSALTWGYRAAGIIVMIFGLMFAFDIVVMLFKWFPAIARVVSAGVSLVSIVFGIIWSLAVIAVAWLFYRPIWGISLLVITIGLSILFWQRLRRKAKNAPPTPEEPDQPEQSEEPTAHEQPEEPKGPTPPPISTEMLKQSYKK